jgi:hypothetical protein
MTEIPFHHDLVEPLEFVPVKAEDRSRPDFPAEYRPLLMIDVIHDGRYLPPEFLLDEDGSPHPSDVYMDDYVRERDWGASIVAGRLADQLGLDGYYKVNTARVLLDFGRFPGSTTHHAAHLQRFAINYPFCDLLGFRQKKRLLEEHYDVISRQMDQALEGKLLKIAVHTYDKHNPSGTARPHVSLVMRSVGFRIDSETPLGLHDPMFPQVLGEFTADRVLRDRVSLTLEKHGIPVGHDYPYLLPEGSPEVRSQVWSFFKFLRLRFEAVNPDSAGRSEYQLVWEMLLDTNLRNSESETLRCYIHTFRRAPRGRVREFARAQVAYREIAAFCKADDHRIVQDYRYSETRHSSLGIEVRKDLVWDFDDAGQPIRPNPDNALAIADVIAEGLAMYLREDRKAIPGIRETMFKRDEAWGTPSSVTPSVVGVPR